MTFELNGIRYGRSLQEVRADPYPDGDLKPILQDGDTWPHRCDHRRPIRSDVWETPEELRCKNDAVWETRGDLYRKCFDGITELDGLQSPYETDEVIGRSIRLCCDCARKLAEDGVIK